MSQGSCQSVDTSALKNEISKSNKLRDKNLLIRNKECVEQIMCEESLYYDQELLNELGVKPNCPTENDELYEIPDSVYNNFNENSATNNSNIETINDVNLPKSLTVSNLADKLVNLTMSNSKMTEYVEMFNNLDVNQRRKVIELLLKKIQSYHKNNNNKYKIPKVKKLITSLTKPDIYHVNKSYENDQVTELVNLKNAVFGLKGGRSIKRKQTKSRRLKRKTRRTYRKQHK